MVGTEKPLFFCVLFRKRKSDFAVLIANAVHLELVEWCPSAREPTYAVPRPTPWHGS